MKSKNKINRVYHEECPKSNWFLMFPPGFQASGTGSCPSETTRDPVSRVHPIFDNSHARHHGFCDRASHALMLGILLQISSL